MNEQYIKEEPPKPTNKLYYAPMLAIIIFCAYSYPAVAETFANEVKYCQSIKNDPLFDNQVIFDNQILITQPELIAGIKKVSRCSLLAPFIC